MPSFSPLLIQSLKIFVAQRDNPSADEKIPFWYSSNYFLRLQLLRLSTAHDPQLICHDTVIMNCREYALK